MKLIQKLFYDPAWSIGYRFLKDDMLPSSKSKPEYHTIRASRTKWYADPFVFHDGDNVYLFVEVKEIWTDKAVLGVSKLEGDHFSPIQTCLKENFHLSYPNVFKFQGNYYMIPETTKTHQLRLYKADNFPYSWKLDCILMDRVDYADCSFLNVNGSAYLFCYDTEKKPAQTVLYELFLDEKKLISRPLSKFINERPGGNAIQTAGAIYRPLQDCKNSYGDHLLLTKMDDASPYSESLHDSIHMKDVIALRDRTNYKRIHTLNRSGNIEVVDFGFDKFYLTKFLRKIYIKLFIT
ncbi:MAG: hypothetical protein E7467_05510 [Ruminococcaceae bacterium]|nr:hypothetical protein [Oscillospiraceae bacterium]